jgi:hypothetical protein
LYHDIPKGTEVFQALSFYDNGNQWDFSFRYFLGAFKRVSGEYPDAIDFESPFRPFCFYQLQEIQKLPLFQIENLSTYNSGFVRMVSDQISLWLWFFALHEPKEGIPHHGDLKVQVIPSRFPRVITPTAVNVQ